jgi:hypothetical protein
MHSRLITKEIDRCIDCPFREIVESRYSFHRIICTKQEKVSPEYYVYSEHNDEEELMLVWFKQCTFPPVEEKESDSIYPVSKEYKGHKLTVNIEKVFEHDTGVRIPHQCILVGCVDSEITLRTTPISDNYKVKHNNTGFMFNELKKHFGG